MADDVYDIYAIRYGHHHRKSSENFIGGDAHDIPQPLDYFVWAIVGAHGTFIVDTGFDEIMAQKRQRQVTNPIREGLKAIEIDPERVENVIVTHLHYDHAGGLLQADGSRAFPRARIVAQRQEWEFGLGTNSRLVASYDQPELRLVADWGAEGWTDGDRELLPGVSVVRTGGHSAGHQAIVVRGSGPDARSVAFFGDLAMRPWSANPRWVTAFDDFPLDSVEVKGELFRRAVEDGWIVVLSHEVRMPVGRLVPDRDRFKFEAL